jgi:hypothetical protein
MRYLIITKDYEPYYTNDMEEFDFDSDLYVINLITDEYYNGKVWKKIQKII